MRVGSLLAKSNSHIEFLDPRLHFVHWKLSVMKQGIAKKDLFLKCNLRCPTLIHFRARSCGPGYAVDSKSLTHHLSMRAWTHPRPWNWFLSRQEWNWKLFSTTKLPIPTLPWQMKEAALKERSLRLPEVFLKTLNIPAVVGWHRDSLLFVCVLMMSDTTNMVGGEKHYER